MASSLSKEEEEVLGILMELPELIAQRAAMSGGPQQWRGKRKRSVPIPDEDELCVIEPNLSPASHVSTVGKPSPLDLNLPPATEEEREKPAVSPERRKLLQSLTAVPPSTLQQEIDTGEPILHECHVSTVAVTAEARRRRKTVLQQAKRKRSVLAKEKADVLAEKGERKKRDLLLAMWRENPVLARDLNICYPLQ